ncbi:MAG TPA: hypothetical protein VMN99_14940, partial [Anaerolineales bacterium]|nr:hypothetical protein [Anaerolineales bacterium]
MIEELDTQKIEELRARRLEIRTRNLEAAQISLKSAGYKFVLENETMILSDSHATERPDDIARILVNT